MRGPFLLFICQLRHFSNTVFCASSFAQDGAQDDVSKALDSTATQWSFQFAYQAMPDYKDDIVNGHVRPEGSTDFVQMRIVAPLAFEKFTILPRLTFRPYENAQGDSGIGNTELFGLIIPKSWDWFYGFLATQSWQSVDPEAWPHSLIIR